MDLTTFLSYVRDMKETTTKARSTLMGDQRIQKFTKMSAPLSVGTSKPTGKLAQFLNYQIEEKEKLAQQQQQMAAMKKQQGAQV